MKNYNEMTENVFHRRDVYVARRKRTRRITGMALAVVMVCLIGALTLGRDSTVPIASTLQAAPSPTQTSPTTQPSTVSPVETTPTEHTYQLTILACSTGAIETPLQEDVLLPLIYYMDVEDIRDLTSEETIEARMHQSSAELEERLMDLSATDHDHILGLSHIRTLRRDNYIISTLRYGSFQIRCENWDDVASVHIQTTTGYGEITAFRDATDYQLGFDITVVKLPSDNTAPLLIDWMYSSKLLEELDQDPTTPLSHFSDIITVTTTYKDGTIQTHHIPILLHDDGSISASLHTAMAI